MKRRKFFGNLIGLAAVATSAKDLAKMGVGTKPSVEVIEFGGMPFYIDKSVAYTNKLQVFREVFEIKDLS